MWSLWMYQDTCLSLWNAQHRFFFDLQEVDDQSIEPRELKLQLPNKSEKLRIA